eukprot:2411579-Rhodomonas_salina.2
MASSQGSAADAPRRASMPGRTAKHRCTCIRICPLAGYASSVSTVLPRYRMNQIQNRQIQKPISDLQLQM